MSKAKESLKNLNDTEKCIEEMNDLITETVKSVCVIADKYKFDRDSVLKAYAEKIFIMSEISTFKNFNVGGTEE